MCIKVHISNVNQFVEIINRRFPEPPMNTICAKNKVFSVPIMGRLVCYYEISSKTSTSLINCKYI